MLRPTAPIPAVFIIGSATSSCEGDGAFCGAADLGGRCVERGNIAGRVVILLLDAGRGTPSAWE